MDAKDIRNLQEAYLEVYESSIGDRARNAVADQRLSDTQSSTQRSVDRLRNMPNVTRGTAALAAKRVERDVKTSSNYGPQRPKPGTVGVQRIEKPKPTGSKPKGFRLGGSSSLSGVGGSGATGGYQVGGSRGYGLSGIRLADEYDLYDIILSHLLDEGYAETIEDAEVMMVNMSEEWRESIVEATAMAKRGHDEASIRQRIAKSTGGGEAADRAKALADRQTYGDEESSKARRRLARSQMRDFRKTTSSSSGLHGYAHKSDDPEVKAKQAARGAQRGALTPREKKQLGR